jgi:integrase
MATEKKKLSSTFVASVKRAPPGKRLEIRDTEVAQFALRVTDRGVKSYIVAKRWPGTKMTIKRTVGDAGVMSLADARKIARSWLELAEKGIDPQVHARKEAEAIARDRGTSFAALAEDFIREDLADKRRGEADAREIRREVISRWGKLPATDINAGRVLELAKELKDKPATGRLILSHVKRLFAWALHQHDKTYGNRYGLKANPASDISPKRLFGEKKPRERSLDDDELRALLVACRELDYPIGSCVELLLLTGCRREEIAALRRSEINLDKRRLVVPPERFKAGASHLVPLSTDAAALLEKLLPRHAGPFVFSTTAGAKPINGWSKAKVELDRVMARELKRAPAPWILHDLRHSIRSRMAALGVTEIVAELVLGHGKKGMARVYNEFTYEKEILAAYELWADLFRKLVTPEPAAADEKVVRPHFRRRS